MSYTSTQVVDSAGRGWTYAYDAAGQLRVIQAPAVNGQSGVTHYAYDTSGNLTQVTDAQNRQTAYAYDVNGNLTTKIFQLSERTDRQYNAANQIVCETQYSKIESGMAVLGSAETKRYIYDASNRLRFIVDTAGDVTEYRYAAVGMGVQQLSSTLTYLGGGYDLTGLTPTQALTESQLASWVSGQDMGQITRVDFSYDVRGALAERRAYAAVDANGVGVIDAALEIVRYSYDAQGLLRQKVEVRGANRDQLEGTSFVYDGMGRLTSTTDALNNITTRVYDDANHQLVVTQANGLIQTQVYDQAGQVITATESATSTSEVHTSQWFYDAEGQLRATQDASGARTYRFYDAQGRLQAEVDGTGAVVEYQHLTINIVKEITYATRVDTTGWLVDGQVVVSDISAIRPPSTLADRGTSYAYGKYGRLDALIDSAKVTSYKYDGTGRLIGTEVMAGDESPTVQRRISRIFYDLAGRQVGVLDAEGYLTEYTYDRAGRQVGSVRYVHATDASLRASGTLDQLRPTSTASDRIKKYFYDGRSNLIGTLDEDGGLVENVFDEAGNKRESRAYDLGFSPYENSLEALRALAVTFGASMRVSRMAYNALGQIITQTNPEGTVTTYSYDVSGRLIRTDTAAGTSEVRENNQRYDVFGNLIGELGGEGSLKLMPGMTETQLDAIYNQYGVTHRYDALGRRIESVDAEGNKTWYVYDASGRQTFQVRGVTDANGVRNGAGEVIETRYNVFGQVQDTTAYTGRITIATPGDRVSMLQAVSTLQYVATLDGRQQFTYDLGGLMASRLDANGYLTRYTYNGFGELKSKTEFLDLAQTQSESTTYAYDMLGRLTSTFKSSSFDNKIKVESNFWDAFNIFLSVDARNRGTLHYYNRRGLNTVNSLYLENGQYQSDMRWYDAYGRVTASFEGMDETTYTYNDSDKSVTVTSPEGVAVKTVHNAFGQTVSVTDGLNETTSYTYDHDGRLISATDAAGATITNEYDVRGLLHRTIDASGRVVELNYDAAGRVLTRVIDPGDVLLDFRNITTTYAYDGQGRQIQVTDPSGVITQMKYDAAGQLIESTVDPLGLALKTVYTWDGLGRQSSVTTGAETISAHTIGYVYDGLGRRISEVVDPNGLALTTSFNYDGNDNVISRTDAAGRVTSYAYDNGNRLIQTIDGDAGVTRMTYDVKGQLVAMRRYANRMQANGTVLADDTHDVQEYRVYDRDGRMRYTVDGAGAVCEYSYDRANRLTQTRHYAATIDINSARAGLQAGSLTPSPVGDSAHDEVISQVYDEVGRVRFIVDAAGGVTESRYDAAGRVIESIGHATALEMTDILRAQLKAGMADVAMGGMVGGVTGNARAQSYIYDGAGRRIFAITRATVNGIGDVGIVTQTIYTPSGKIWLQDTANWLTPSYQVFESQAQLFEVASNSQSTYVGLGAVHSIQYAYDTAGRLRFSVTPEASPYGAVTEWVYDAANQVVAKKNYNATYGWYVEMDSLEYWTSMRSSSETRTTEFQYDNAGRLTQQIDALGHAESWTYDGAGQKTSYTNRNNQTWTYQYDGAGHQVAEISPQVAVTSADANGQITQVSRAIVTRLAYDGLGNVIRKSEDADGGMARTTEYGYDNRGHQILTRFPDAGQLDSNGNVATTGAQPTIEVTYDALGNAVVEKDVQGNYRHRVYDAAGRLSFEVDQDGGVTGYEYNVYGEQVLLTRFSRTVAVDSNPIVDLDPRISELDRTITTVYDLSGRKIEVRQSEVDWADGAGLSGMSSPTTRYTYNAFGELVKESVLRSGNADDATAQWADTLHYYDELGRQFAMVDAEGHLTRMEYDAQGELIKQTEFAVALSSADVGVYPIDPPAGDNRATGYDRVTEYQYDALGRKVKETAHRHDWSDTSFAGSAADVVTDIVYDNEGHAVSTSVSGVTTQTSYDALGRAQSITEQGRQALRADASDQIASNMALELDNVSSLYQWVSPYTTMAYDAFGNVIQVRRYAKGEEGGASAADQIHTTRYDWQGRAVWERDEAGTVYTRVYDAADHIVQSRYRLEGTSARWAEVVTYATYDASGRQTSSVIQRETHRGDTGVVLSVETDSASYVDYNVFGEIVAKYEDNDPNSNAPRVEYRYDAAGRMYSSNEGGIWHQYRYDLAGNQTEESHEVRLGATFEGVTHAQATTRNQFDLLGRMVRQTMPTADNGAGQAVVEKTYDRWGNVLGVTSPTGGFTEYQYNELNQVIVERRPTVSVLHGNGTMTDEKPVFLYGYNALGQLAWSMNALGGVRVNTLNNVGQVVATEDGTHRISSVAYNALGEQELSADPMGHVTFQTFDTAGRVTAQGDFTFNGAGGRNRNVRESYVLNQNGNRLRVTDALGNAATYDYDSRGLMLRSRTAAGVVMDYAYDYQGHKIRETNALSDASLLNNTSSALSNAGVLPGYRVLPAGRQWSYVIPADTFKNPWNQAYTIDAVVERYQSGGYAASSDFSFDSTTGTISGQAQLGASYRITFKAHATENGDVATAVMYLSGMDATQFDTEQAGTPVVNRGIPDMLVAPNTAFAFNLSPGTFVEPQGQTLTYSLRVEETHIEWIEDESGSHREWVTDYFDLASSGLSSKITLDPATGSFTGNVGAGQYYLQLVATDPDGNESVQEFTLNASVAATQPARRTVTDSNGQVVNLDEQTWEYNLFGQLVEHHDLSGARYAYTYDDGQQILQHSDWSQSTITTPIYDYVDENDTLYWNKYGGRPDAIVGYETTIINNDRELVYYANGQLAEIREGSNWTKYEYDASGNRTAEETLTHNSGGIVHLRTEMMYDSNNRLARVTQIDLGAGKGLLDLRYSYDAMGNRMRVMVKGGYGASQPPVVTTDLPPVVVTPLPDAHLAIGVAWSWAIPAASFKDPEKGPLRFDVDTVDDDWPDWLDYDPTTRTFSGTPTEDTSVTIRVTVTDLDGKSVTDDFVITAAENQPPVVVKTYPLLEMPIGQLWTLNVADAFEDPEGQPLTFVGAQCSEGASLPDWLHFDATTGTFSGTPSANELNNGFAVYVTVQDSMEAQATLRLDLHPILPTFPGFANLDFNASPSTSDWSPSSNGPVVAQHVGYIGTGANPGTVVLTQDGKRAITAGQSVTIGVQFDFHGYNSSTQGHGVAGQTAVGQIVWYDSAGNQIGVTEGTKLDGINGYAGWTQFAVTANAPTGAAYYSMRFMTTHTISSASINVDNAFYVDPNGSGGAVPAGYSAPPILNRSIANQGIATGTNWSFQLPTDTFTDADTPVLNYSAYILIDDGAGNITYDALPSWLTFDEATRTFSGTTSTAQALTIAVTASDGTAFAQTQFALTVSDTQTNQPPHANGTVPAQAATIGQAWSYQLPVGIITDPEGQALTWTASLQGGGALPSWLSFNASTQSFSGAPDVAGNYSIVVTATDPEGAAAGVQFTIISQTPASSAEYSGTDGQQVQWYFTGFDDTQAAQFLVVYEERADGSWQNSEGYYVGGYSTGQKYVTGSAHAVDGRYNYRIMIQAEENSYGAQIHTVGITPAAVAAQSSINPQLQMLIIAPGGGGDGGTGGGGAGGGGTGGAGAGGGSGWTGNTNEDGWEEYWYSYDVENRMTVAHGEFDAVEGQVVVAKNNLGLSYGLEYDVAGRMSLRWTHTPGGGATDFTYEDTNYDERGQRTSIIQSGLLTESFSYDAVGRQTAHRTYVGNSDGNPVLNHLDVTEYDADGRTVRQASYGHAVTPDGLDMAEAEHLQRLSQVYMQPYDAAGRMTGYSYTSFSNEVGVGNSTAPSHFSQMFAYTYEGRESYLEKEVRGSSTDANFKASTSTSTYDAWGRRIAIVESTPNVSSRTRLFDYDMEGNILQRTEADSSTTRYAYVQGQNVASGGSNGSLDVLSHLTGYQTSDVGTTNAQVQAGDTLQNIAQRVYGNSNLWYVLAEANALSASDPLVAGTTLKIPQVQVTKNDATTFKPFSANEAIGNTAPSLPYITPPPKQHCNTLLMVIIIVVAVIVTIYTAGATAGAMGSVATGTGAAGTTAGVTASAAMAGTATAAGTSTFATGLAALAGGYGTTTAIVAGAVGGAVGSIASQAVGSAMGASDFSWKNVAVAAITGGVTAGVGSYLSGSGSALASNIYTRAATMATVSTATSYAANKLVGNDVHFSWKELAANVTTSIITASATKGIAQWAQIDPTTTSGQFKLDMIGGVVGGIAGGNVRKAFGVGGAPDYGQIAVDVFSNVLANSLAGQHAYSASLAQADQMRATAWITNARSDEAAEASRELRYFVQPDVEVGGPSDDGSWRLGDGSLLRLPSATQPQELDRIVVTGYRTPNYFDSFNFSSNVNSWSGNWRFGQSLDKASNSQAFFVRYPAPTSQAASRITLPQLIDRYLNPDSGLKYIEDKLHGLAEIFRQHEGAAAVPVSQRNTSDYLNLDVAENYVIAGGLDMLSGGAHLARPGKPWEALIGLQSALSNPDPVVRRAYNAWTSAAPSERVDMAYTASGNLVAGWGAGEAVSAARLTGTTLVQAEAIGPEAAIFDAANTRLASDLDRIAADGHAIARHGGAITDSQLMNRSLMGYAPDGSVKLNPKTQQPILPPMSTAFYSDDALAYADNALRQNYLEKAVALSPIQNLIRLNGVDLGVDLGRGYARIGSSSYNPSLQGPLQRIDRLQRVDAVYKWSSVENRWVTDTIFPTK
ncbi:putative Ig domain-containing protein [Solilutibacter silvestris]|uniref:putative Ig domain-containing protein n=1 Tax=Solilutibacter silvestris TaxID=1645665 RepID=UPI003D35646A